MADEVRDEILTATLPGRHPRWVSPIGQVGCWRTGCIILRPHENAIVLSLDEEVKSKLCTNRADAAGAAGSAQAAQPGKHFTLEA